MGKQKSNTKGKKDTRKNKQYTVEELLALGKKGNRIEIAKPLFEKPKDKK